MNISLPEALRAFVEQQVAERGFGTSSESVREWIRREQDRASLRALLREGAGSAPQEPADKEWFEGLRRSVRSRSQA